MKPEGNISRVPASAVIDPRSVPKSSVHWPAAFRLRPARLPATEPLALLGSKCSDDLLALKALTSPAERHKSGTALLPLDLKENAAEAVLSAFAGSLPEWRFAPRGTAHMLLASSITAAVSVAAEIYGQFMCDTAQKTSTLSFAVERYQLTGRFADVSDVELFPSCYEAQNYEASQGLTASLAAEQETGLLFQVAQDQAAIIFSPGAVTFAGTERALALEWNGSMFHRAYDYRDMYWRDMSA